MHFTISFDKRAIKDFHENILYYETQQAELGKRFAKSVEKTLEFISKNPYFEIKYDDIRCLLVKKFPFRIHYRVDEKNKKIKVYAITHTSKSSQKFYL
jgi:mRNA-degrading endonuclease RelE of RelBE toxin-antitoxin system